MKTKLIIVLAATIPANAQNGGMRGLMPYPPEAMDWAVIRCQEESLISWLPSSTEQLLSVMPQTASRAIREYMPVFMPKYG